MKVMFFMLFFGNEVLIAPDIQPNLLGSAGQVCEELRVAMETRYASLGIEPWMVSFECRVEGGQKGFMRQRGE